MSKQVSGGQKLVIVESPTKAKTIRKFLGKDFVVESCMGHIRDLPQSAKDIPEKYKKEEWATLGVNVDQNFEPIYCVPNNKTKVVKTLKDKMHEASELYLATDEDREGESISWHLVEVLKPKIPIKRMVFHEITKEAIQKSLNDTREIDFNLVRAQEARRILDRLVGYTISPLLWKKVAYGLSAGRVQSVAVKLISEKELERVRFKKSVYWGVSAELSKDQTSFESRLISSQGKRVATGKDFDGLTGKLLKPDEILLLDEKASNSISQNLKNASWNVSEVEEKPVSRRPAPPFITSTLQQESNRKLGLSSRETMQVAQKLYEQGFITYMRTDSTFLSTEAVSASRSCILQKYGNEYLPKSPINYAAKKVKGAQEAHEAIRPAGNTFIDPVDTGLTGTQFRLYELIWKRTVASQMVEARQKQVSVKIQANDCVFAASGMTIEFPGFLRAYVEGSDDPDSELAEREVRLPKLSIKDKVDLNSIKSTDHETKPPARYTEASLVQTMEKEGIGRPSTYASIIGTIIDRGYVKKAGNALVPTFTALVVSKLLDNHLHEFVDLGFTSEMEKSLDTIAEGDLDWKKYLGTIYFGPKGLKKTVEKQADQIDPEEARSIHLEGLDAYTFKVGRFGAYVETKRDGETLSASIPEKDAPADITPDLPEKWIDQKIKGADALGKDPVSGQPVYVLSGRFGPYVQLGESSSDDAKPKRVSIPAGMIPEAITMKEALELLSLPKTLGVHPEINKEIKAGIGRFGPYVVCSGDYRSIPKTESIFSITFEKALELFSQPKKGRGQKTPLKEYGVHPDSEEMIQLMNGPYGQYLKVGKKNFSIPEGVTADSIDLAKAIEIIGSMDKVSSSGGKKASRKSAGKTTSKVKESKEAKVREVTTAKTTAKSDASEKSTVAKSTASKSKSSVPKKGSGPDLNVSRVIKKKKALKKK